MDDCSACGRTEAMVKYSACVNGLGSEWQEEFTTTSLLEFNGLSKNEIKKSS